MTLHQQLQARLQDRSAHISIVGVGYVGLPLAVAFAEAGFCVTALDVDERKIDYIKRGESYIEDVPTAQLQPLVDAGTLRASNDYAVLQDIDVVIISVPTPLRKTRTPNLDYVTSATDAIREQLHPGMLIVLESTTYPGTTDEVIAPRLQSDAYTIGDEIFVAFSGERIDPGNETYSVHNTPKVIGGMTDHCTNLTTTLYSSIVEQVVPVSSPRAAEMTKLVENTFRLVNIGLVNEMAVMCDKLGLDVWEVINAASTKPFGFMPFYPGPGVGGHCIPLDPHYLSWKLRTLDYHARFIDLASDINTSMPPYVVNKVGDALNRHAKPIHGSDIVILGVAYKPNVNDVRESPALPIVQQLRQKGGNVRYHDPHVPDLHLPNGDTLSQSAYSPELLQRADCVVIVTNHESYDWAEVLEHSSLIVDTRNVYAAAHYDDDRIVRL